MENAFDGELVKVDSDVIHCQKCIAWVYVNRFVGTHSLQDIGTQNT